MNKIIDGKLVSSIIKENLKKEISSLDEKLTLVVIQVGNNEASNIYVNKKINLCNEIGINSIYKKYDDIDEEILIKEIEKFNNDSSINGILVQLPLPDSFNTKKVINSISYKKDVDGLTSINLGKLYNNEESIIPCTAKGIMKLLDYYNVLLEGKKVSIVGRSNLVGIPLFKLLLDRNCTVTMCHSKTKDLKSSLKESDIIISATGKKGLITRVMVKEGTVVIDVGISRIENKIYGDVCFDEVEERASLITKVPGGVGPMTVICLMENTLDCYKIQKNMKNL
ncbi:MAG: bifunctional 5,10-methylenetetrahydrofolate dehydrogenase/5,10-methenyltetrahydrofolate cyclohydrolase [bacterium]|nr:bifunctional 5,10-methylenetetrahydrofolate dehydrogenase/5,10-methenyltetrahydrofolate cyclohydrolase [bacterium]